MHGLQRPFISVIVPCYNQAKYLDDALRSIYEQTYSQWECIIINDGSTDDTEKRANQWVSKDQRFRYVYQKNGGLSSARNKGLELVKGEYVQFLDADDTLDEEKFSVSLIKMGDGDVLITNFNLLSGEQNSTYLSAPKFDLGQVKFAFETILTGWDETFVIPIHCGLFKRTLFDSIRFNETLRAREDWLMWLQIYRRDVKTVFIDLPYARYRVSAGSMSQNRLLMGKNLALVYKLAYEITPDQYRAELFQSAMKKMEALLDESESIIVLTRRSFSYRFGNFFARSFRNVKLFFE